MSYFIKLAFFNYNDLSSHKPKQIIYYPDVEVYRSSKNKSEYHTFFYENKIGDCLGEQILEFVNKPREQKEIRFKRILYDKPYLDNGVLSYSVDKPEKSVRVYVHEAELKIQLLSMFKVEAFRTEFRKEKHIKDHVTYIETNYKKILLDTVCDIEGLVADNYTITVNLVDINSCNLRQSIGYFLYMLQATELIGLEQMSDDLEYNVRKIRISEPMDLRIETLKDYIYDKLETAFGGEMQ